MRPSWAFAAVLAGCTPTLPFHLAETAEVLDRKAVSLNVAGGGGGARDVSNCCGGGAVRVRVGVGHAMEVGAETSAIGNGKDGNGSVSLGGKLSYKYAPLSFLALVAGVGMSGGVGVGKTGNGEPAIGADFAVVASTPPLAKRLRIYGGPRFSFVVPLARDIYDQGGPTEALIIPAGLSIAATDRLRFFVEGGYVGAWSEARLNMQTRSVQTTAWYGGYGAFAVAYTFGGPTTKSPTP